MPNKSASVIEEPEVVEEAQEVQPAKASKAVAVSYYAIADFEIANQNIYVKAGEQFILPRGWERNKAQEEFLHGTKQKNSGGSFVGLCFTYLGEIINPGEKNVELRERRVHTVTLPLEAR